MYPPNQSAAAPMRVVKGCGDFRQVFLSLKGVHARSAADAKRSRAR